MSGESVPQEASMAERAVIDRIVDGTHAVLLIGEGQIERIEPVERLPADVAEGDWLQVHYCGDTLVAIERDPDTTSEMRRRIAAKRERLRRRGSRARPKDDKRSP